MVTESKMPKLYAIMHPVKKEFRREKCGFDHTPADDFVKSQWQNRTKSIAYLIYRWIVALFFVGVVIQSMVVQDDAGNFWLYFIYMTNWGVLMCMLTNLLGAILVTLWHYHPEYADKLINMESLTSPFRVYWSMHIISLVLSIVVTVIYWSVLHDPTEGSPSATNVLTHIFNSVLMFIDLLIVAHPLRLLHIFLPVLFGICYAIFSVIYQKCGGVNKKGKPYIYHVIDWRQPGNSFVTVVGVLLLTCFVYMLLFTIYKLRTLLYRRLNNASYYFPTSTPSSEQQANGVMVNTTNGIQRTPSGISMVLGNYPASYNNQAFTISSEKLGKY